MILFIINNRQVIIPFSLEHLLDNLFMPKRSKLLKEARAGNLLICSLLIRSFAHCSFAHLFISLKSNEQLWAIRSDRSRQMRDCERIAQVAQDKWATVSELLRSLKTNERQWVICSGRSRQMSDSEWIAQVAHHKWATVSNSLRSLMINERPWVICS